MAGPEDAPPRRSIVSVEELTDPTLSGGKVLSQDIVDLGARRFAARRVTILLERCIVIFHATNSRVRSQTALPPGRMGFVAIGPESSASLDGRSLTPELMLAVEAGGAGQLVVEADYESVSCLIPPEELRRELHARQRLDGFDWPSGADFRRPDAQGLRDFFEVGSRLGHAAVEQPELFQDNPTVRASAELDLLEALMAALASAVQAEPTRSDRTHLEYGEVVQAAQRYALGHCYERVYVSDLCRVAHVSERTLQNAFRATTGMTPVGYLTRVRLHRAREALAEAAPSSKTVTEIAHALGFWHMGEFSRQYKECFDDLPSETLRRT